MSHPIHNLVMESIFCFVLNHLRKELQIINNHFKTCIFLLISPNFTWLKLQWHQMHHTKWIENSALLWSWLWKAHLHLSQRDFHIYTMLRCAKTNRTCYQIFKTFIATSDHNYIMKRAWTFCRSHRGHPLPIRNTLKETSKKIYI